MQFIVEERRDPIIQLTTVILAIGMFALLLTGCGSSQADRAVASREILTADEIAKTSALTAYDAIQVRRPAFLAGADRRALRDVDQPDPRPVVYVNGVYYGPVESLRDIPVREIREIRFLEANDATRVLGSPHVGGVIMVGTKLN